MSTAIVQVSRLLLGSAVLPNARAAGFAGVLDRVAMACVAVGLFTVSWDRFANVPVTGYNVKIAPLAFTVAAACALPLLWRGRSTFRRGLPRVTAALVAAVVVVLVLSSLLSAHPAPGVAQVVAVLTGCVAPAGAVLAVVRDRAGMLWGLRWFLAGATVACAFGLYQLLAFYSGLPQFIPYTGVGVGGGAGRIAAFSYEPAYFANFVLLAFGAATAAALLRGGRLGWVPVIAFAVMLVLVNVRALFFLVPVLLILLAVRWRQNRVLLLRAVIAGVVVVAANAAITAAIEHASKSTSAAPVAAAPTAAAPPPASITSPRPQVSRPVLPPRSTAADAPTNVLNPNEESSNAPRLALYRAVIAATAAHPVLGVGPGNLHAALEQVGYVAPNQGAQVVANNIWLQAYADGGILLVVLEGALIGIVVVVFVRRRLAVLQPIAAAWLSVILVSGMLTSFFFDVKLWSVLGLLVAGAVVLEREVNLGRTPAAR